MLISVYLQFATPIIQILHAVYISEQNTTFSHCIKLKISSTIDQQCLLKDNDSLCHLQFICKNLKKPFPGIQNKFFQVSLLKMAKNDPLERRILATRVIQSTYVHCSLHCNAQNNFITDKNTGRTKTR